MSSAADEDALLALPVGCRGVPCQLHKQAIDSAEAMLPASTLSMLGAARAEEALSNAAAHWLVTNGYAHGERTSNAASGIWAGSSYGDHVAALLAQLPRTNGRSRRYPLTV